MLRGRNFHITIIILVVFTLAFTHWARPTTFTNAYKKVKLSTPGWALPGPARKGEKLESEKPLMPEGANAPIITTTSTSASAASTGASAFEKIKYPFQDDLNLKLPSTDLSKFAHLHPHNHGGAAPYPYAYAAFMNTRNPSIRDPYFMALQNLIWRVLWSDRAKTKYYPFIAFVAPYVTQEQRNILAGAGAIVRELDEVEWTPDPMADPGHPIFARFKDMFGKLHMWNQTDFSKILFLDADAFPVTNIDDMLYISEFHSCDSSKLEPDDYFPDGTNSCERYVFSGVPQGDGPKAEINVGAMVFSPSPTMYQRFMQNFRKYDRYVTHMADQGFMTWQFKEGGAFPAQKLDREYDGFFPQENEKGKLKVVHDKLWADWITGGWMKEEWDSGWKEMIEWYDGPNFVKARQEDEKNKNVGPGGFVP